MSRTAERTRRIENLPAGDYVVKVGAPGYGIYAPAYSGSVHTQSAATAQTVTHGETTQAPDIELAVGGSISGRITAPEGLPLSENESAEVFVYDNSGTRVRIAPTYLGTGDTYHFSGLAPGKYRVEARQAPGPARFVPTYSGGAVSLTEATPTSVEMGTESGGVDIAMVLGGSITGRITGPGGEPIRSVGVGVLAAGSSDDPVGIEPVAIQHVGTEADGMFRLGALPTGDYVVLAHNDEHVSTYFGGTTAVGAASRLQVELGSTTANVEIVMEYGGVITGVVTPAEGGSLDPAADIEVSAFDPKGALAGSVEVASDGSYRVAQLRRGWHRGCAR
ncbi:MAG: hypothetical protein WC054_09770 [Candidatus Nanopelagicales bacterium]